MSSARTTYAALVGVVLTVCLGLILWLTGALASAAGTLTWSTGAKMPFKAHEAAGTGAAGKLYVFGGYNVEQISEKKQWTPRDRATAYDPATNTWTELAALPPFATGSKAGVTHAGTATDDAGSIYLAGGYPANSTGTGQLFGSKVVLRYDIAKNEYTRLPDLPSARGAGGLALIDGQLHFLGGSNTGRATVGDHWALDLSNTAAGWKARAALPSPRNHLAVAVAHGRIFVAGGQVGENADAITSAKLEAYSPATDRWNTEPDLPKPLSHLSLFTDGDRLMVLGGETGYTLPGSYAYSFDTATETWSSMTSLLSSRSTGVGASIGGKLFYAGGGRSDTLYIGAPTTGGGPSTTPAPTATPTPGSTPTPTPAPAATATPKPAATATPKPTGAPTPTTAATPGPGATQTPAPTAGPQPTAAPTPRVTPFAEQTTLPVPITPAPTNGPGPATTETPDPGADGRVFQPQLSPRIERSARRGYARLRTLVIDPQAAGATATIRCTGGIRRGCPRGKAGSFKLRKDGKLTLRGAIVGRALRPGATIEVRIAAPGKITRVQRLRIGKRGRVTAQARCLPAGAKTPQRCPAA